MEEVEFMNTRGLWKVRPLEECWEITGKAPVSVRWVDTNKGTDEEPMIRSRYIVLRTADPRHVPTESGK